MSSPTAATGAFPPTFKTVKIEDKGKYAIVTLNRCARHINALLQLACCPVPLPRSLVVWLLMLLCSSPVNGMNLELWTELLAAIDACEQNANTRGVIFASGLVKGQAHKQVGTGSETVVGHEADQSWLWDAVLQISSRPAMISRSECKLSKPSGHAAILQQSLACAHQLLFLFLFVVLFFVSLRLYSK